MIALLLRRRAPLDEVGCKNDQQPRCRLERECEVRGTGTTEWSAILLVAAEERRQFFVLADDNLHSRHYRAAQRARDLDRLGFAFEAIDHGEHVRANNDVWRWGHEAEPEEAAITDQ